MLYEIPDNLVEGRRFRRVAALQLRLVRCLIALPAGAAVPLAWLQQTVWPDLPAEWVQTFWELDKGRRQEWLATVAACPVAMKRRIRAIYNQQRRFLALYGAAPPVIEKVAWASDPALKALRYLLLEFYSPLAYKDRGYPEAAGNFDKDKFITGFEPLKVCPYCTNNFDVIELDHFLPKEAFPFLSCHPDHLIPCCHDSNRFGRKGSVAPLDWNRVGAAKQANAVRWFHPRLRPAYHVLQFAFAEDAARQPTVSVTAPGDDAPRALNFNRMFKLTEFWNRHLVQRFRELEGDVIADFPGPIPNEQQLDEYLALRQAHSNRDVPRRGLALLDREYFAYVRTQPMLITDLIRACENEKIPVPN